MINNELNVVSVSSPKEVVIKGKVMFDGKLVDIIITKWDTKNNVVAFHMIVMGKKFYVGAGKDTPKLSDIENITFTFK